jgi:hypothetical protein
VYKGEKNKEFIGDTKFDLAKYGKVSNVTERLNIKREGEGGEVTNVLEFIEINVKVKPIEPLSASN